MKQSFPTELKKEQIVFDPVDLPEGRILTLAATLTSDPENNATYIGFGYSLKNPTDATTDPKIGKTIAKGRSEKKPCAVLMVAGVRIPKPMLKKLAEVFQEDFKHRLNNYVQFSKPKRQVQQEQTTVAAG